MENEKPIKITESIESILKVYIKYGERICRK